MKYMSAAFVATQLIFSLPAQAQTLQKADQVAMRLSAQGLPITDVETLTPSSDPNQLLGRPGYYTSKVFFTDSRYSDTEDSGRNTIEGFATAADAKRRADYVNKVAKALPMLAQYVYQRGRFVLRLQKQVHPDHAAGYWQAFSRISSANAK